MILRTLSLYLPAKIVPAAAGFFFVLILTRTITAAEFGLYSIYLTTLSIISIGCYGFLNASALRFYQVYNEKGQLRQLHATYGINYLLVTIAAAGISAVITSAAGWPLYFAAVGSLYLLLENSYNFFQAENRMQEKPKRYAAYSVLYALLRLGVLGMLIAFIPLNPETAFLPGLAAYAVIAVYSIRSISPIRSLGKSSVDLHSHGNQDVSGIYTYSRSITKESLQYGFPFIAVSFLSILLAGADRYLIRFFLGEAAVGMYSLGYRLVDIVINNIALIILFAAYPVLIRHFELNKAEFKTEKNQAAAPYQVQREEGKTGSTHIHGQGRSAAEFSKVLESFIRLSGYLLMPAAGAFVLFSNAIIRLLFPDYSEAAAVMPVLAGGALLFGMTYLFSKPFELVKKPSRIVALLSVSVCINILLNAFLIPLYGIIGAASSTLISYGIYAAGSYLQSVRYIRYTIDWFFLLRTVLCAVLAGAAAHLAVLFLTKSLAGSAQYAGGMQNSGGIAAFLQLDLHTWPHFLVSAAVYAAAYVLLSYLLKTYRAVRDSRLS